MMVVAVVSMMALYLTDTANAESLGSTPAFGALGNTTLQYSASVPVSFDKVSCSDSGDCVAVGGIHAIYSTNGGITWNDSGSSGENRVALNSVSCFSSSDCVAVGSGATKIVALFSRDGGHTWYASTPPTQSGIVLQSVICYNSGDCVATGFDSAGGAIFYSNNGGEIWTSSASMLPSGIKDITRVFCYTSGNCLAEGYGSKVQAILTSTNGGVTWSLATPSEFDGVYPSSITCSTPSDCVAVGSNSTGSNGVALFSRDAGLTWTKSASSTLGGTALSSVSCFSISDCVAVGAKYNSFTQSSLSVALYSTNGGVTWSESTDTIISKTNLYDASCFISSDCVAVGYDEILYSGDGGVSWSESTSATLQNVGSLYSVSCFSISDCVAVGANVILSSNDGGVTWSESTSSLPGAPELASVSCFSISDCVAVGAKYNSIIGSFNDVAFYSNDGGVSWSESTSSLPGAPELASVSCFSISDCVAVGASVALYSTNGGVTWTASNSQALRGLALVSVSCTSLGQCEFVGDSPYRSEILGTTPVSVTSIAPWEGSPSGGTRVIITGSGFSSATAVDFGSTPAVSFTVISDSEIQALTPGSTNMSGGLSNVTVITPEGSSVTSPENSFIYLSAHTRTHPSYLTCVSQIDVLCVSS